MITFVQCNIFELIWYSEFILPNFLQKLGFFINTKGCLFQPFILTKFSSCSLKFLVHKEEENAEKDCENVAVDKKKCLRNI